MSIAGGDPAAPGEGARRAPAGARVLTGAALEALLGRLGPDRERAAEAYESVRRRLIRLFEWRAWSEPEALADETIDRVARRLAEGVEIRAEDPYAYFAGVAVFVLRETARRAQRERAALSETHSAFRDEDPDLRIVALEGCLGELASENRALVLGYYTGEGNQHLAGCGALAQRLGLEPGALRVRVHRLRQRLEECVRRRLGPAGSGNVSASLDTRE